MTRAFVAIRPPAAVLDAIAARVAGVAMPGGRSTTRDQWHITLQFLGDDADIDSVVRVFEREPIELGAGEIAFGGADALGDRRRARILALRLNAGAAWTQELAEHLERRLAPLGHVRDIREEAFLPHLTLCRFRTPSDLRPLCASIGPEPVGRAWSVEEVVLFESSRRPQGAQHIARANFPVRE